MLRDMKRSELRTLTRDIIKLLNMGVPADLIIGRLAIMRKDADKYVLRELKKEGVSFTTIESSD